MKKIQGSAKNLRELLANTKFAIDYYQREYRWRTKEVFELIDDLFEAFIGHFKPGDPQDNVKKHYGHYFLGSIIICSKDGRKFIIDGQQRLTTLTLLLIYLYQHLPESPQKEFLGSLIYSYEGGTTSFNLNVEEREVCMQALYDGKSVDESGKPESVVNIIRRYHDIEERFPNEISEQQALPHFADWLIDNVNLIEITARSDSDAYVIFETMNDRGLSVTPTEMLKGYLLANITDDTLRNRANSKWRDLVHDLRMLDRNSDADAIRAWMRAQYARTIRERKKGAEPRDYDRLGTEFHRWIRENADKLGLKISSNFGNFIEIDFDFYAYWYTFIHKAATKFNAEWKAVHFLWQNGFTLLYPVLLAPLCKDDSEDTVRQKLQITSSFLDILIARRIWNFRAIYYSAIYHQMFQIIRDIRRKNVEELPNLLRGLLKREEINFSTSILRLTGKNRSQVHHVLARMTDYVETQSGRPSNYGNYSTVKKYHIEHLWAVPHYQAHTNEFDDEWQYKEYRSRIGGLVLLNGKVNSSLGALPYKEKLGSYLQDNLLAASLHEEAYDHNPGFQQFKNNSGLPFTHHTEFRKRDFDKRQELYQHLAEQVWSPERLAEVIK